MLPLSLKVSGGLPPSTDWNKGTTVPIGRSSISVGDVSARILGAATPPTLFLMTFIVNDDDVVNLPSVALR